MFNSTFCGLFVQCLGKFGQGWWSAPEGPLVCFGDLMASVTHTSEVRQSPTRAGLWGSAVPAESRASYPPPGRVGDVHTHLKSCRGMGGREGNALASSAPRISGAYLPEALMKEAVRTGAIQGVEEMNQG